MSVRVGWVDTTKGFAILLVVIGHVWRGLENAGLLEDGLFRAVDSRIYAFHMPLFFLLAGLFFPGTLKKLPVGRFIVSRLSRMIYPLMLWTYVFIAFKLAAGSMSNSPIGVEELYIPPIPGRWHFWFLWALFLMHISMLPLKPLIVSRVWQSWGLWLLLLASLMLNAFEYTPQVKFWVGPALKHLPYFILGMIIGRTYLKARISPLAALVGAAVFLLVLAFVPQLYRLGVPTLLTATLLSLGTVVFFMWIGGRGGWVTRALSYAGERSMAIFLAHVIFAAGVREVLMKLGVSDVALHMVLGTIAGVMMPIILHDLAKRLNLVKFFGF